MTNSWTGGVLSDGYVRHSTTLRGALRHALVAWALDLHLPPGPLRILDVGGGNGIQALRLASQGRAVTLLDPDPAMLAHAEARWKDERARAAGTLDLVEGRGEDARQLVGDDWDAVLCHGVLMYLPHPEALLEELGRCARKGGGLVSILTKNADALAMRPALEGRPREALEAIDHPTEKGNLGVESQAHRRADIENYLRERALETVQWYGVRVFTDHLGDAPPGEDFPVWLELEWEAGIRSPYRDVARLFHLVSLRR